MARSLKPTHRLKYCFPDSLRAGRVSQLRTAKTESVAYSGQRQSWMFSSVTANVTRTAEFPMERSGIGKEEGHSWNDSQHCRRGDERHKDRPSAGPGSPSWFSPLFVLLCAAPFLGSSPTPKNGSCQWRCGSMISSTCSSHCSNRYSGASQRCWMDRCGGCAPVCNGYHGQ